MHSNLPLDLEIGDKLRGAVTKVETCPAEGLKPFLLTLACRAGEIFSSERSHRKKFSRHLEFFMQWKRESLKRLCELGMSRELRTEQKDAISTLVSGKDLVLPTGFGKSLIFT